MPTDSAPADREALYFQYSDLDPGSTYKLRASFDPSYPLDATLETLVETPFDPDPAGFDVEDDDLVAGASTYMRSLCRAAASVLVFTAKSLAEPGVDDTQAVYQYEPSGKLTKALAIAPLAYPALPSGATNRSTVRTTLRDFVSGGDVFTNTGVLSDDTDELDSEAPTVDWSDYTGMVPVDFASRSYTEGSATRNAHAVRFYDPLRERLVTATFTGTRRNSTAWRNIMSRAIENTSDFSNSPEGTVRLTVGATQVLWRDDDDNVLQRFTLSAVNSSGVDAIIVGSRILVLDSALRQVFAYNPDGSTTTTGPPPPELATFTVNGRSQVVLGQDGPFTAGVTVVANDLPYRPHLRVSGASLDPATRVTVEPALWTFEDLTSDDPYPSEGTRRSKAFTITVASPIAGVITYSLTVTLTVGPLLPTYDPNPPPPPPVDPGETPEPDPTLPPTASITVSPASITEGDTAFVTWASTNGETVSVTRDGTEISTTPSGTFTVSTVTGDAGTQTFAITVTNDHEDSPATDSATLTIAAKPVDPDAHTIDRLALDTTVIASGGSTTLRWNTTNSRKVTINGTDRNDDGTLTVRPASTTTYTLVSLADSGAEPERLTQSVTLVVQAAPTTARAPSIDSFTRSPATVTSGQSSTLTWTTSNAETVTLDGRTVAADGSQVVSPVRSTTYTLVASSTGFDPVTRTVSVQVGTLAVPSIDSFTATPSTAVDPGDPVVLRWATSNTATVTLNGAAVAVDGSQTVRPQASTSYVLVAGTGATAARRTLRVVVNPTVDPPEISATVSPSRIDPGGTATLTVSTQRATSLFVNGRGVQLDSRGGYRVVVRPTGTTTYRLRAVGPGGVKSTQVALIVNPPLADPTADLTASDTDILAGEAVVLTYRTTGSTSRTINGVSQRLAAGTVTVAPTATTTYTLRAVNANGVAATDTVTVNVTPAPEFVSLTFGDPQEHSQPKDTL